MALADRTYAVEVIVRAVVVTAIWLTLILSLDLPHSVAVSGVVFAWLFAWWEERKADATHVVEVEENDEPFEETPPTFYR
jgi:hypothetical protein